MPKPGPARPRGCPYRSWILGNQHPEPCEPQRGTQTLLHGASAPRDAHACGHPDGHLDTSGTLFGRLTLWGTATCTARPLPRATSHGTNASLLAHITTRTAGSGAVWCRGQARRYPRSSERQGLPVGRWSVGHSGTEGPHPGPRSLGHVSVRTGRHDASAKYDDERLMFVNARESGEAGRHP